MANDIPTKTDPEPWPGLSTPGWDSVDEAGWESFPASDPPAVGAVFELDPGASLAAESEDMETVISILDAQPAGRDEVQGEDERERNGRSNQENIMRNSIALIVGALALGGCASSQANRQPTAAEPEAAQSQPRQAQGMRGGTMGGDMAGMCPMAVEGTTARAEDVEGGAAIVFTTTGDVAELRRRVAHMADMHNQHYGDGHGHMMGMHGAQPGSGSHAHGGQPPQRSGMQGGMMGSGMMPPSTARSEEIEGGARLVFTPRDPAELANLREHVHQRAEQMASGRCPMMSMHGQGAEAAPPSEPSEHETHHPEGGD